MKIAFYIPILNVGGAEKVMVNLLKQLSLNEEDIYFLITDSINSIWIKEIDSKVKILNVDSKKNILNRLYNINKAIKNNKIDIVVSHLTHSNIHCSLLKLVSSFKLILVEHSITSHYIESLKFSSFKITHFLIKRLYNYADSIVCVSEACKNDLVKKFKVKLSKTYVIYNPIDFDAIQSLSVEPLTLKITEFIGERKYLVSVGRLEAIKNHKYLIESLKDYLTINDFVLVIIGDGSEKNNLEKLIDEFSLNKNVLLVGYDLNPYKYISKCQLLIHPSKFEGFGLVLIEALFLQKEIVSFNFEVAYEVLENGNLGSIVYDKVTLLSAVDSKLNQLNQNDFSKKVYNSYNLKVISNQYHNLFDLNIPISK